MLYDYLIKIMFVRQVKNKKNQEICLDTDLPREMTVLPPKGQAISRGETKDFSTFLIFPEL